MSSNVSTNSHSFFLPKVNKDLNLNDYLTNINPANDSMNIIMETPLKTSNKGGLALAESQLGYIQNQNPV
jgi:hypothetical protein